MKCKYEIEKMDHLGRGIIKIDGKTVFVNNALVGDVVDVVIKKKKRNFDFADVKEHFKLSSYRREFCKFCSNCGGCQIGELNYEKQLEYKQGKVQNIINKYLKCDVCVNSIVYSNDIGYRNKIVLHVKDKKIGLYKNESQDIVEIDSCLLVNPIINDIIIRLKRIVKGIDCKLTKITIKCSNKNEVMLIFDGEIDDAIVMDYFSDVKSIFINNRCLNNLFIEDKIGDYNFLLSRNSFFQVNRFNTENLYNEVLNNVKKNRYHNVLDLYCGTGTIGIYVSKYVDNVLGIEVVQDAIDSATQNKIINNVDNIDFICGKVEDNIEKLDNIDLIIVDPPRSGLDDKTIDNILRINPEKIIYVSCDAMSLIRDLNKIISNYNIDSITPVDMFPNTSHVESVSVLHRKTFEK